MCVHLTTQRAFNVKFVIHLWKAKQMFDFFTEMVEILNIVNEDCNLSAQAWELWNVY